MMLLHLAHALHHFQRGVASAAGVARFLERRAPEGHHRIADVLVKGAVMIENEAGHVREILIEEERQVLGVQLFGNSGEAPNIAEHHGDVGFFRFDQARIYQQAANDFRAKVLAESRSHPALFFFLEQRSIQGDEQNVGTQR